MGVNPNDIDYDGDFHPNEGYDNPDFKDRMLLNQSVEYTRGRNLEDLGSPDLGSPDLGSPDHVSPDYVSPDYVPVSPDYGPVSPDYGPVSPDYVSHEEKMTSKKINIDEMDNDLNLKILNVDEEPVEVEVEKDDIKII